MSRENVHVWSEEFLNDEQKQIAELARDFARKEIHPHAAEIDREHRFPKKIVEQLAELGFLGMMVPSKWGGSDLDCLSYTVALEEIGVACASSCTIMSVMNSLVCYPLMAYGSDEQKKKALEPLAQGKKLGCFCLSEPGSGSDAAAMKCVAKKTGEAWTLQGVKNWITNGKEADWAIVFAMTEPEKKQRGVSAFLVDCQSPGVEIGKVEEKLGILGTSTTQIHFDGVQLSKDSLLGDLGQGFKIALDTLDGGRIGIATQAVAIARACVEEATIYALEREAFGRPIAELGAIQHHLSEMQTKTDAARLLVRQAARKKDRGQPYTREAAQAKLFAARTAMDAATRGIQVLGGFGYTKEYSMERHFRDAKITEIYEGTNEIQRLVIAHALCKEIQNLS